MKLQANSNNTIPTNIQNNLQVFNTFRGETVNTNPTDFDVNQINTSNITPLEQDTVNISTINNEPHQKKKRCLP